MTVLFLAFMLVFIVPAPATAQTEPVDPLAFTPTGDALWDTYARAQLDLLQSAEAFSLHGDWSPPALATETLDAWEAQFGDDPRYWQLRYWEEMRWGDWDNGGCQRALVFLQQGLDRSAADGVTGMLVYRLQRQELDRNWEMYADGTLPPDSDFAPVIENNAAEYSWYVNARLVLADELVSACPEESWAWYERAITRFEFGRWEDGLADLKAGNVVPRNRLPQPFPMSFVAAEVGAGGDCGSEIATGMVLQAGMMLGLANFIRVKDQVKNQEVRWSLGAPLEEAAPWHAYACRLGVMEGADPYQWLVAYVLRGMVLRYLFVEAPEAFTVEQRQALWGLYGRGYRIRELAKETREANDLTRMIEQMATIEEEYGIDLELLNDESEVLRSPEFMEMMLRMAVVNYRFLFADYKYEAEVFQDVKLRFEMLATFNWDDYSWPDPE